MVRWHRSRKSFSYSSLFNLSRLDQCLGCLLLSLVVFGISRPSSDKQPNARGLYAVVIDAGSTGSRVLIFLVHKDKGGQLQLATEPINVTEIEPGISSYADNPRKARDSIEGLLKRAESFVPVEQRSVTPLILRATAGVRKLPLGKQEALMNEIRGLLLDCQFNTKIDPAAVMTGSDEGVYGWLSVNFLLNRLDGDPRLMAAAMDMGGGSTQVVFPILNSTHSWTPDLVRSVQLAHQRVTLYSQSYLGLGMSATRVAVLAMNNRPNATKLSSTCVGHSTKGNILEYSGVKYLVNGVPKYSCGDSHCPTGVCVMECRRLVQDHVSSLVVSKPTGILQFDIVAFSGFYYNAKDAGLLGLRSGGLISMEDLNNAIRRVCKRPSQSSPFLCLDLIFIHTLLTEGYGFHKNTNIQVVKSINNYVVSWSLGLAYQLWLNDACLS